jgi:A/G-specific adenine glycosylase
MTPGFGEALLDWYAHAARDLPWRGAGDPYAIWVSEVMLQQTRVETVIPYYLRWMERFPNVRALADAEIDEILGLWEGMGYYRRAHNLHRTAANLIADHDARLPTQIEELTTLPGIGPYTANAIAAIAFNQDVIALDGNLRRVLARVFYFDQDPRSPQAMRELSKRALEVLPKSKAASFNQALMDLGAEICTPRKPNCVECPVVQYCKGRAAGKQNELPISKKVKKIPHRILAAGVLRQNGKVLLARRPEGELLGGLWEFPSGQCETIESVEACIRSTWQKRFGIKLRMMDQIGVYSHAYSHFRVTVHALACQLAKDSERFPKHEELRWVPIKMLATCPMGKVDRAIAKTLQAHQQSEMQQG